MPSVYKVQPREPVGLEIEIGNLISREVSNACTTHQQSTTESNEYSRVTYEYMYSY